MSDAPSHEIAGRLELDFTKDPAVLGALVEDLDVGVFTVDAKGRFVAWSAGAERITGYRAGDVKGRLCNLLDGPDCKGFSGVLDLLTTADATRRGIEKRECRVHHRDGRQLHLAGSVGLLRDGAGEIYGAVGVLSDLTEILRLNAPNAQVSATDGLEGLVGRSPAMREVFRRIRLAASSDVTTLVTGESGTGKELAARGIHALSDRADRPFVAINCSAIPESLLESELFGHAKGAFTGAVRDHRGVFETADGGTLFLDEIGEVSQLVQVKLLRVLQEREIQRVGGSSAIPVDVRLVTATHRDLRVEVADGRMREDFFYRIRVFEIRMPALRERAVDIPLLATHFVDSLARAYRREVGGIAQDALETLVRYPWPGNVRELRNAIEHALVVQTGHTIGLLDLPEDVRGARSGAVQPVGEALSPDQEAERLRILDALDSNDWNRTRTAEALGVSRVTLWKKIRRYGIDEGVFRGASRSRRGR